MKVLHIITNLELGGAQKATLNLCSALLEKGYDVYLATSRRGLLFQGAKEVLGRRLKIIRYLRREIDPFLDLLAFFSLYIYIRENRFHVVHTHTSKAGIIGRWAGKLAGVPYIIHTAHGFPFHEYQNPLTRWFYIFIEKITALITDKIILVSQELKTKALRYRVGRERQYEVIYELVKLDKGGGDPTIKEPSKSIKVGMVACLKPQKRPQDFVRVAYLLCKEVNGVEFILVGDGKLRKEIEDLVRTYGLKGKFKVLGWRTDAYQIMRGLDIFVLTSIFEGLPHVIIEAMSLGLPIVATSVDGVKEFIRDGENGFLCEPRCPKQMAKLVKMLIEDQALRLRISSNALRSFKEEKKLDFDYNLSRIEKMYRNGGERWRGSPS